MNKLLCLLTLFVVSQVSFAQTHLYVATNGNDSWSGTLSQPNTTNTDGPKLTLYGARNAIRALKTSNTLSSLGAIVDVKPGKYYMDHTLFLNGNDSGTQVAPIIYRSSTIHQAWLEGALPVKNWVPLDARLLPRVQATIAPKLVCADLKALGVTDFGSFPGSNWAGKSPIPGAGAMELFVNGYRQTVARWPNTGYSTVTSASTNTSFVADFSTSHLITNEADVWLCGFSNGLNWGWDSSSALIDRATNTLTQTIANPYPNKAGGRFYIKNSLAELDSPGEYYVDKATGLIVWYPNTTISTADIYVSTNTGDTTVNPNSDMVRFADVHDVQFLGFTAHYFRGDGFVMQRSYRNTIMGNVISNIEGTAARIYEQGGAAGSSHDNILKSNDIRNLGEAGIQITAGDQKTLISANNQALNNSIKNFGVILPSYRCGVDLRGVGNVAQHNDIQTSPHIAIIAGGNNQVVDSNHINNVCMDSSDAGAIYTGGAQFTEGGHQFTNNYIENAYGRLDTSIWAIYLDSKACRINIQNNVVRKSNTAYFINGGREVTVNNNIAIDCTTFIQVNDYNPLHASTYPYPPQLTATDYQNPPYSVQYPRLPNILNDDPQWPKWDQVTINVGLKTPKQYYIRTDSIANVHMDASVPALNLRNTISWLANSFSNQSMFVNESAGNFTPMDGTAAYINGFKPILASNIGIITDQYITRP